MTLKILLGLIQASPCPSACRGHNKPEPGARGPALLAMQAGQKGPQPELGLVKRRKVARRGLPVHPLKLADDRDDRQQFRTFRGRIHAKPATRLSPDAAMVMARSGESSAGCWPTAPDRPSCGVRRQSFHCLLGSGAGAESSGKAFGIRPQGRLNPCYCRECRPLSAAFARSPSLAARTARCGPWGLGDACL